MVGRFRVQQINRPNIDLAQRVLCLALAVVLVAAMPLASHEATCIQLPVPCPARPILLDVDGAVVNSVEEDETGEPLLLLRPRKEESTPSGEAGVSWGRQIIWNDSHGAVDLWREGDGTEHSDRTGKWAARIESGAMVFVTLDPPRPQAFYVSEPGETEARWRFSMVPYARWYRYFNSSTRAHFEAEAPGWEARRMRFLQRYFEATGQVWEGWAARPPPRLPMLNTSQLGHTSVVHSSHPLWQPCPDTPSKLCRPPNSTELQIRREVLCSAPQLLLLHGVLSPAEADFIRVQAIQQGLVPSQTNDKAISSRRNSSQTWLKRGSSALLDTIFRRLAEVVGLPEAILWPHANAEMLQVVKYLPGEVYNQHTDWGGEEPWDRYLTVLLYLSDPPQQGGRTAFPRAERCLPTLGTTPQLHPAKGSALAFYSMVADGNFDKTSEHAALPIWDEGTEKWVCNLWVWEPTRRGRLVEHL